MCHKRAEVHGDSLPSMCRQAEAPLQRGAASSCQWGQLQQLACWHMSRRGLHLGFWRLNSAKALRTLGSTLHRQTERQISAIIAESLGCDHTS